MNTKSYAQNISSKATSFKNEPSSRTIPRESYSFKLHNLINSLSEDLPTIDMIQGRDTYLEMPSQGLKKLLTQLIGFFTFEENVPNKLQLHCLRKRSGETIISLTGLHANLNQLNIDPLNPTLLSSLRKVNAIIEINSTVRAANQVTTLFIRLNSTKKS